MGKHYDELDAGARADGRLQGTDNCARCGQAMVKRLVVVLECEEPGDHKVQVMIRNVDEVAEMARTFLAEHGK